MVTIGKKYAFNLHDFQDVVFNNIKVNVCPESMERLQETRQFIAYLLEHKIKSYGITTGFADLRNQSIESCQAAQLSQNIITSHDAGIGETLSHDVVLGAMVVRASSLSKGHSGITCDTLKTLVEMINRKIVPLVPKTGSLGASGDLAFLARLGRAMCGEDVPVWYEGTIQNAKEALKSANIPVFVPSAKEGLAITNGTSFMISMLAIAYLEEIHVLENILAMQGLFFNAIGAVDAAFNENIQDIRHQVGQKLVRKILYQHFENSPFMDFTGVQDDYCVRCVPQIFGSKIELILEQYSKIERELDAVTDNPLIFKNEEITKDVNEKRIIKINGQNWVILSGGNFHGECITTIVDAICTANVKIILTMERQITYMLNPFRNKNKLPCHLIVDDKKMGLLSGYMITQYTANALAQRIAQLGMPTSIFNITSANESEDVVSYGATAAEKLLEQLQYMKELNVIYLTVVMQAYGIARSKFTGPISDSFIVEKIFKAVQDHTGLKYPTTTDENFIDRYQLASSFLKKETLSSLIGYPLKKYLKQQEPHIYSKDLSTLMKLKNNAESKEVFYEK